MRDLERLLAQARKQADDYWQRLMDGASYREAQAGRDLAKLDKTLPSLPAADETDSLHGHDGVHRAFVRRAEHIQALIDQATDPRVDEHPDEDQSVDLALDQLAKAHQRRGRNDG